MSDAFPPDSAATATGDSANTATGTGTGTATATPTGGSSPTGTSVSSSQEVPKSTKPSLAGPIAGGIVGGFAVLGFVIVAFLLVSRRRRAKAHSGNLAAAPYYGQPSPNSFAENVRHEMPSNSVKDQPKGIAVHDVAVNQVTELPGSEAVAKE